MVQKQQQKDDLTWDWLPEENVLDSLSQESERCNSCQCVVDSSGFKLNCDFAWRSFQSHEPVIIHGGKSFISSTKLNPYNFSFVEQVRQTYFSGNDLRRKNIYEVLDKWCLAMQATIKQMSFSSSKRNYYWLKLNIYK